jgi:hypothetical protein
MQNRNMIVLALVFYFGTGVYLGIADDLNTVPVTAPIDTDSAGRAGDIATHSVIRILCPAQNWRTARWRQ